MSMSVSGDSTCGDSMALAPPPPPPPPPPSSERLASQSPGPASEEIRPRTTQCGTQQGGTQNGTPMQAVRMFPSESGLCAANQGLEATAQVMARSVPTSEPSNDVATYFLEDGLPEQETLALVTIAESLDVCMTPLINEFGDVSLFVEGNGRTLTPSEATVVKSSVQPVMESLGGDGVVYVAGLNPPPSELLETKQLAPLGQFITCESNASSAVSPGDAEPVLQSQAAAFQRKPGADGFRVMDSALVEQWALPSAIANKIFGENGFVPVNSQLFGQNGTDIQANLLVAPRDGFRGQTLHQGGKQGGAA